MIKVKSQLKFSFNSLKVNIHIKTNFLTNMKLIRKNVSQKLI